MATIATPPSGVVSFLFTDIEGSTAAWERAPTAMPGLLARHDLLIRAAIEPHGGYVFATGGDGFAVAFPDAGRAVVAAVAAQRALRADPWPAELPIRVRMAINTGEADERDGDYFGPVVNRAARLMATANGGQLVVSERTAEFVSDFPEGVSLESRGRHLLKDLRRPELVHEVVIDGLAGPPLRAVRPATDHLPDIRTSFVGRRHELAVLAELARRHRLVTVVGPGGAGKTRLAIEHAALLEGGLRDGAWFVDLSTAVDADVMSRILTAVGLPASSEWGALRSWRAHIVLDNCEHIVDAAADVVDDLLAECPDVCVVATSREALAVPGEQTLPVSPMSTGVDDAPHDAASAGAHRGSDAIRLFVDRARSVDPGFDPSPTELDDIAALCVALDGLPLAIELAASRIGTSSIGDLATGLLGSASTRRDRRRTGRHRSLRSTMQWSVDLMDEPTRIVFGRLSVFEGGFTADAAAHVATDESLTDQDVREIVTTLVEQSMVQSRRTPVGPRLSMLETVRTHAGELLADEEIEIRRRHLAWIGEWSNEHAFDIETPGWFGATVEIANQRAGLRFALDSGDDRAAVDLVASSVGSMLSAGFYDIVPSMLADLRGRPIAREPWAAHRLDMTEMVVAEIFGDFDTSHALAERFRAEDDDEMGWLLGSALQVHHFAATSPADAHRVFAEFEARTGRVPMAAYLRAEIALAEADFGDATDVLFAAFAAEDISGVERRLRSHLEIDPLLVAELTLALYLTSRVDEATVAVELLADASSSGPFSVYVPLVRAVVGSRTSSLADVVDDLRTAAALERRWEPPLVALDCLVLGALVAADRGRVEVAAEALGATRGMPQRSVSGFGVRRTLRRRLVAAMGDEAWTECSARGRGRSPRAAFDRLIDALAA